MASRKTKSHAEHEEVDSEGSWAVSYGDMVTLLLTFFILFFSMEKPNPNSNKLKLALLDDLNSQKFGAIASQEFKRIPADSEIKNKLNTPDLPGDDPNIREIKFPKEFKGIVYDMGDKILIEFPGISFFNSAQVELTREGRNNLAAFTKLFMPYAGHFYVGIRAFADPRKVKRDNHRFRDNVELSALRSISTLRELQTNGIPINRIRTGGFGELIVTKEEIERLPASKRTPSVHNDLARRVILVIEQGGKS